MSELPSILPIEIPELNRTLYLPLCLEKLTQPQYERFIELLFRMENKEIDYYDFSVLAIYALLDIKKGSRKIPQEEVDEALSNISMLTPYIAQFFDQKDNILSLKLAYTHNHIPEVKGHKELYYGPAPHYEDVQFGEYEDGLNIFLQYNETPSPELLQQLMATFYRPLRFAKRTTYVHSEVKEQSLHFSKVPMGALYGFYYNFAAFHTYFSSSQVYYNGKVIDLSILFTDQPEDDASNYTSPYPSLGLKSTGIEIAKTGILGNLQEVRSTPLWEVALLLYDMRKKDLDERARTKQLKKSTT